MVNEYFSFDNCTLWTWHSFLHCLPASSLKYRGENTEVECYMTVDKLASQVVWQEVIWILQKNSKVISEAEGHLKDLMSCAWTSQVTWPACLGPKLGAYHLPAIPYKRSILFMVTISCDLLLQLTSQRFSDLKDYAHVGMAILLYIYVSVL